MDDRIRSDAVSPDWRRGLLWAFQARIAIPASAGRHPHKSPERKRRRCFRAVAAVQASAPAGRDHHKSPERKRRDSGAHWARPAEIASVPVSASGPDEYLLNVAEIPLPHAAQEHAEIRIGAQREKQRNQAADQPAPGTLRIASGCGHPGCRQW